MPCGDQVIDAGHDVLVVALAPRVDDRALARLAVSGAAARHRKQHRVAEAGHAACRIRIDLRHEVHELREQPVCEPAARPAVDVDEQSAARRPAGTPDGVSSRPQISMPSNDRHLIGFSSPASRSRSSGLTSVIVVTRPLATSMIATSPIVLALDRLVGDAPASALMLMEKATVGPVLSRSARPSATDSRTIGCSNMCSRPTERAVVGQQVDRAAVARPHILVHPGIVQHERAGRATGRRDERQAARRHDVAAAVGRDEGDLAAVRRKARSGVHARAIDNRPRRAAVDGDCVDARHRTRP